MSVKDEDGGILKYPYIMAVNFILNHNLGLENMEERKYIQWSFKRLFVQNLPHNLSDNKRINLGSIWITFPHFEVDYLIVIYE